MKKILTTVLFLASIGMLQSCQQSARVPEKTEEDPGGAGAAVGSNNTADATSQTPVAVPGSKDSAAVAAPKLSAECQVVYAEL